MHSGKCQRHTAAAAHTSDQLSPPAAKQEPYQKAYLNNIEEFSGKMSGEWASR